MNTHLDKRIPDLALQIVIQKALELLEAFCVDSNEFDNRIRFSGLPIEMLVGSDNIWAIEIFDLAIRNVV